MSDNDFVADSIGGADSVTEVTTTGWLSRIGQGFIGALIGIVLVIGSVVLLWWNEGRAVEAVQALDQGAHQIVEINSASVDRAADGKLVHASGMMETRSPARDPAFGVGADNLLRLKRTAEMYQWKEEKTSHSQKNVGGSETTSTTYSYHKEWLEHAGDSSHFHEPNGHRNPPMPVSSATFDSNDVRLSAYRVDHALLANISAFGRFDPHPAANPPAGYRQAGDYLYRGQDDANPAIGDIRVHFAGVPAQTMSVVAADAGGTLGPFHAANGYTIALADPGVVRASQMFKEKARQESILTWVFRVVGFVLMLIGLALMTSPLSVLVGVIPFFEDLVGAGAFLLALIVSVPLTLTVIAAAWIAHRPLLGAGLIVAAIGLAWALRRLRRQPAAPAAARFQPAAAPRWGNRP
jgi:hypothetical protein